MTKPGESSSRTDSRATRRAGPAALRHFAVYFLLFIPVLLLLYPWVLPPYQRTVVAAANAVLDATSSELVIEHDPGGGWQTVYDDDTPFEFLVSYGPGFDPVQIQSLFLSLAILPALLLATPVPWPRRFGWVALGVAGLWVVHVASVVVLVETPRCLETLPNALCHWIRGNVAIGGQLFALALWAVLTWGFWLPLASPAVESASGRRRG